MAGQQRKQAEFKDRSPLSAYEIYLIHCCALLDNDSLTVETVQVLSSLDIVTWSSCTWQVDRGLAESLFCAASEDATCFVSSSISTRLHDLAYEYRLIQM